jgi:hypothetical protein
MPWVKRKKSTGRLPEKIGTERFQANTEVIYIE